MCDKPLDPARLGTALQRVRAGRLRNRSRRNGPHPRLSAEQQAEVAKWVEQGPDLERDGVVRWRCIDLQRRIMRVFDVSLHERTVGKLLRKLSFRRLSVRPQDPQTGFPRSRRFQGGGFADLMTSALPPGVAALNIGIFICKLLHRGQLRASSREPPRA